MRERRRVQDHHVKRASLLPQAPQPPEDIAVNELVLFGIKPIQRKVPFSPFEIFLRQIQAGYCRARFRRTHRKAARVRKGIENGAGTRLAQEASSIIALIKEQPSRIPLIQAQLEQNSILTNGESLRRRFPKQVRRTLFARMPAEGLVVRALAFVAF